MNVKCVVHITNVVIYQVFGLIEYICMLEA